MKSTILVVLGLIGGIFILTVNAATKPATNQIQEDRPIIKKLDQHR